jgi:hypothetical protein
VAEFLLDSQDVRLTQGGRSKKRWVEGNSYINILAVANVLGQSQRAPRLYLGSLLPEPLAFLAGISALGRQEGRVAEGADGRCFSSQDPCLLGIFLLPFPCGLAACGAIRWESE